MRLWSSLQYIDRPRNPSAGRLSLTQSALREGERLFMTVKVRVRYC